MANLVYGTGKEEGLPEISLPSMGGPAPQDSIPSITIRPSDTQPTEAPPVEAAPAETPPVEATSLEVPTKAPDGSNAANHSSAIQEALSNGYTQAEIASFLQTKGLSEDDADMAVVDSVKTKVKEAKDGGYSDDEISSFLATSGYEQELVSKSIKASSVDEKYRDADYKPATLTEEDKAMELSDLYTNVYEQYSTTGKKLVGMFDEDEAVSARKEVNKLNYGITEKLKKEGLDAFIDDSTGDVMLRNKDGNVSEVDSSFLQSMWNAKGEFGGAVAGGMAGARGGAVLGSVVPGIGTAAGTFVGAVAGGAIGASLGRGIDLAINASKLSEDISSQLYMTQMKQAGIYDATMGVIGAGAFKVGAKGYKGLTKAYKYFTHGNPKGSYKALKYNLNITDDEVKAIIDSWETLNAKVAPGDSFEEKAIGIVSQTTQGAEGAVKAAAMKNERIATVLKKSISDRAKGLHRAVANITDENTGALVKTDIAKYRDDVKQFFGAIKEQATSEIDGTDFRFDLDKLAISPVLRAIEKKLSNPIAKERFVAYAMRIDDASADRTFGGLLELRAAVNDFKYSKTLNGPDEAAINTVINKIDGQIGKAVKEYMPTTGKEWLDNFKLAKTEYSQMKQLEDNALFKQLMRPGATEEMLQKSISKYGNDKDVDAEIFNKVVERLSPAVRTKVEGAAIKNSVKRWTVGEATENQAIDFPSLAAELDGLNLQTKTAKGLASVVREIAKVYKNDIDLASIAGRTAVDRMQATLSADLASKAKYTVIGALWNNIVRYLPTRGANNLALVHQVSKLFENPLNARSVEDLVKQLPVNKQAEMRSLIKDLQVQIAKRGPQAAAPTVNMYKQTKYGTFTVSDGQLGKGIYLVDKVKNPSLDSKVVKQVVDLSKMASLDTISSIVGKDVTVKDVRKIPNLQQQLIDRGYKGIKVDDKAVLFGDNAKAGELLDNILNKTAVKDAPKTSSTLQFTKVDAPQLYHGSDVARSASTIRGNEGVTYFTPNKALAEEAFTSEGGVVSSFSSSAKLIDAEKDKRFIDYVREVTSHTGTDDEVLADSLTGASSKLGENKFKLLIDYLDKVGADGVKIGSEVIIPNSKVKTVVKDATNVKGNK